MKRIAKLAVGVSALVGLMAAGAGPASAALPTDVAAPLCGATRVNGPVCYFYGEGYTGAQAGFTTNKTDLLLDGPSHLMWYFNHPGLQGHGFYVGQNAASAHNRNLSCDVEIFSYPKGGQRVSQIIRKGDSIPRLKDGLRKNNMGHRFINCG